MLFRSKNNVIREAQDIFLDRDFIKKLDTNKHLLCFNNGVIDFREKIFRDGKQEDYISMSTNIDYIPIEDVLSSPEKNELLKEVKEHMKKIFPNKSVRRYMYDHLAASLSGEKKETFHIYRGSGKNGKSILSLLMSEVLGDYKGTAPVAMVTQKRTGVGNSSSEIAQLKGKRYVVMQEPEVGASLNEGILKEISTGEPLQAREVYKKSEIFEPQFSLIVCTNALFVIKSNDDGLWRRVRLIDFVSKFLLPGEEEMHQYSDKQYVHMADPNLRSKLPKLAPVFASLLVARAFETDCEIELCEEVVRASNKYRESQDIVGSFINANIYMSGGERTRWSDILQTYKLWCTETYGEGSVRPKPMVLEEEMIRRFGNPVNKRNKQWVNVKMKPYGEDDDDDEDGGDGGGGGSGEYDHEI